MYKLGLCFLILLTSTLGSSDEALLSEESIQSFVQQEVSQICEHCSVDIHFNSVIDESKNYKMRKIQAKGWKGRVDLFVLTNENQRIKIPVDIRWKDKVVVARKNIRHGKVIQTADVKAVTKDVTFLKVAYARKALETQGYIGKRMFHRGQIIDESMLKKPNVVRYGQPVKLILEDNLLTLTVSAKAKGTGAIGDRIPVMISKTKKKIMAKIIEKNILRVE